MPVHFCQDVVRCRKTFLANSHIVFETTQSLPCRGNGVVIAIESQKPAAGPAGIEYCLGMSSPTESSIEIALARFRPKIFNDLSNQYRNMREAHLMTSTVSLPVIIETLDRVFKRRVIFKETIHPNHSEDIPEKWTHSGKLQIAV